jgi:glycosyltransferase involved in cell wall biosynthesis
MIKVLYVEGCRDGTVGGSHTCLYSMVANLDRKKISPVAAFYYDQIVAGKLRDLGVETHIFRNEKPLSIAQLTERFSPRVRRLLLALLPIQKAVNVGWLFLRPAVAYARFLKKHEIDILHLNNSLNTNHDWMLAAKLSGTTLISHERGISPNLSRTARALGGSADRIICMSKVIGDPLLAQGFEKSKVVVVYDGIDPSRINARTPPEQLRAAYRIGHDDPVIGIVGNIKDWKGQETVIRATAILKSAWPQIRCLVVGGFGVDDPYKAHLDRVIDELGLHGHVVFTGFQSNPADFLNIMDVVVHASILPEPFGMVNLEAMYMKKAVVSTNVGGPTEIFSDGEDGILIQPGSPTALAEKITLLLERPEFRLAMGVKAHESVLRKFTVANTARQVERIYEQLGCE